MHNYSTTKQLFIVAGDVKALYPSISRSLALDAIRYALLHFSNFGAHCVNIFVNLISLCLDNIIVQYENDFFVQERGIVTGDNHSVSIANITLHYVLLPFAKTINHSQIFKRFIDDIVWLSFGQNTTQTIKNAILTAFCANDLEISFRQIQTGSLEQNTSMEFLDVDHVIDSTAVGGFYTKEFIKPTALNRTFLHGKSHHPISVFKSIVFGEAVRMRRLNESNEHFQDSLERLRSKCLKSNFNNEVVNNIIEKAKLWTHRFSPKSDNNEKKFAKRIVWSTSFKNLLHLFAREKNLNPYSSIVYKRPPNLCNLLTNYKKISLNANSTNLSANTGISAPCRKCALCGHHGNKENMVKTTSEISNNKGKTFKLRQNLNCTNYGIYAAQCRICSEFYVGQSKNRFSIRCNSHRSSWNSNLLDHKSDKAALYTHFHTHHHQHLKSNCQLWDAFQVIFLQQPVDIHNLDIHESKWINKLGASINIAKTILPLIK